MATADFSGSPWWTFRTSRLLHYLFTCKRPPDGQLSEEANRRRTRFGLARHLFYALILVTLSRHLYTNYRLGSGGDLSFEAHRPYNPLMTICLESFNFVNSLTVVIVCPTIVLFAIVLDYMLCFKVDYRLYKLAHELMIDNAEQLVQLNRDILNERPSFDYRNTRQFLQQWSHLIQRIWRADNLQFKQPHLHELPNLSAQLRARLVVYSAVIEGISTAMIHLLSVVANSLALSFLVMVHDRLSIGSFLIFFLDLNFITFGCLNTLRVAFLVIHFGLVLAFVSNGHISELNGQLCQLFSESSHPPRRSHYRQLDFFYVEYSHLKSIAEHTNALFISSLFSVMFFTVISLSIVDISSLLFQRLLLSEQFLMVLYFTTTFVVLLLACAALIGISQSFYLTEPILYRTQGMLVGNGSSLIRTKLKLMAFYEELCTTDPFCFTVGPFGNISKQSLYQFCFFYSGMVMFVSSMIRDGQFG